MLVITVIVIVRIVTAMIVITMVGVTIIMAVMTSLKRNANKNYIRHFIQSSFILTYNVLWV